MLDLNQRINRRIAHGVVAKILEDMIVDERIDAEIPAEYEEWQTEGIAKEVEAIMNEHVAAHKGEVGREQVLNDLAMLTRILLAKPTESRKQKAWSFLQRHGLAGSILRAD